MSFLQPWILLGLPLVALPIIIHLINQRRFQTIRWGAMMFLLAANKLSRGYARLRQWLIMAFRMAAIAGLVFAVSRPMASGWLGLAGGGRPETTIILLDRSPSMQQSGASGGESKLATGRRQLAQTLGAVGSTHWVLIESTTKKPRELESPQALLTLPETEGTSSAADLPAMLEAAFNYIQTNKSGRTDIWICSDIRQNDWDAESGRWRAVRESFLALRQGIRCHLLAYPEPAAGNMSVRVSDVRWQPNGNAADLVLSLRLAREGGDNSRTSVPVHFEIDGARSEMTVEMEGDHYELKEYRIPMESKRERGWGKVTIPADVNPADNDFYFAFEKPVARRAIIVVDDSEVARPLQLAAAITPDPNLSCSAEIVSADQLPRVEWEKISLLFWQAPLPDGEAAKQVHNFVDHGGYVIFLPPKVAGNHEWGGMRWKGWVEKPAADAAASASSSEGGAKEAAVESWRSDQDLLARTQSGATLPLGQLQIHRYCELTGDYTPLATLRGGAPLLARATENRNAAAQAGGAYFLATTPAPADSTLATNGVVLYALVQRALAGGAAALGSVRQADAGDALLAESGQWQRLAGSEDALSTEYPFHRGVYTVGDRLVAVNRPVAEDRAPVLEDGRVAELFRGLDFVRADHQAGQIGTLIREIWRPFLAAMIVALLVEAGLCLPRKVPRAGSSP
jgi:Aerotolerance regulator N-terminal